MLPPSTQEDAPTVKLLHMHVRLQDRALNLQKGRKRIGLHGCFRMKTLMSRRATIDKDAPKPTPDFTRGHGKCRGPCLARN